MPVTTIIFGIICTICGFLQFHLLGGKDPGPLTGLFTYGGMLVIAGAFAYRMRFAAISAALIISTIILTKHMKNIFGALKMPGNTPEPGILIIEVGIGILCTVYLVAGLKWLLGERKKMLVRSQNENS